MPIYEYRCDASGVTLEVSHAMSDSVSTWGDLCERTGHAPGNTAPSTPVEKVISVPIARGSDPPGSGPGPCGPACGCH